MDIDDLVRIGVHQAGRQDLHIAGENQEIYFAAQELEHTHLIGQAMVFLDGKMIERNVVAQRNRLQVWMIAENTGDIHRQFTTTPTPEQVRQAMVQL